MITEAQRAQFETDGPMRSSTGELWAMAVPFLQVGRVIDDRALDV